MNGFERAENELEKLSIQMITILKKYKEKGIIGERDIENIPNTKISNIFKQQRRNTHKTE